MAGQVCIKNNAALCGLIDRIGAMCFCVATWPSRYIGQIVLNAHAYRSTAGVSCSCYYDLQVS